jgi:hypothetical protein
MAFYQGKLYALADDENLLVVNISQDSSTGNPQVSRIGQVIKGDPDHLFGAGMPDDTTTRKKLYLVESHVKMATGPIPRFPAENSPIRGRDQNNPHGDLFGRNPFPVGDG